MSRELKTIQEKEKLNQVFAVDEAGPGGASHIYEIISMENGFSGEGDLTKQTIQFQKGPRSLLSSVHGVIDSDLLEIVRDRLTSFQLGEYACASNAQALYHVEEALKALNQRVEDRIRRNVLGTNEK
jgi:hypothetical protein